MTTTDFENNVKTLIDNLKGTCTSYGLGNDGNEFKIITQVFLYKFMNDKFAHQIKQLDNKLAQAESWEDALENYSEDDYEMLLLQLDADTAKLKPEHLISHLFNKQNEADFAKLFDDTLRDIAITNNDVFSVKSASGEKDTLFDRISEFVDGDDRDNFCKAIINHLVNQSFEAIFDQKYDFYATIFEYLIKDYNKDGGGKYAEYYTPHAVAKIMAAILIPADSTEKVDNATVYDPSAGSGTLLMNIAHAIGEDRCTLYSQDISKKSSGMLRLNLILNGLVHSIHNVIRGNTILSPFHKEAGELMKFDYIVSNPPFKMDFSDFRDDLDTKGNIERFFAGIPKTPKKAVDKMAIYSLFLQHIIYSLEENGKAAIVVPTGFITAQAGIDKKIRQKLVDDKMLAGVVSMPSNIFATTGTNVSILFLDKNNKEDVVLLDASNLGETVKEDKNQRTVLTETEENKIINAFNQKEAIDDFSVVVSYDEIKAKNYSFSAGQYFEVKIEYVDITAEEFETKMKGFTDNLDGLFAESRELEGEIKKQLGGLAYE